MLKTPNLDHLIAEYGLPPEPAREPADELPSRPGRPSKLSRLTVARIVRAKRRGAWSYAAARAAGVSMPTFVRWVRRGRAGEPGFRAFVELLDRAERRFLAEVRRRVLADLGLPEESGVRPGIKRWTYRLARVRETATNNPRPDQIPEPEGSTDDGPPIELHA